MSTVQITLPRQVAVEAFGFYLFSREPKTTFDLSAHEPRSAFEYEISDRLGAASKGAQIAVRDALLRGEAVAEERKRLRPMLDLALAAIERAGGEISGYDLRIAPRERMPTGASRIVWDAATDLRAELAKDGGA